MAATKVDQAVTGRECPTCQMRYRFGEPKERDFASITVNANTYAFLLAAALEFDKTAERITPNVCWTAVDFIDWLRDSLITERAA